VAFFPILANTTLGLRSADRGLHDLFTIYGATRWQRLRHLQLPSALPYFLGGLRIAGGLSLIGAVVAEYVAGTGGVRSGLAFRILEAGYRLNIPRMFAALLLIAAMGVVIFAGLSLISHLLLRKRVRAVSRPAGEFDLMATCSGRSCPRAGSTSRREGIRPVGRARSTVAPARRESDAASSRLRVELARHAGTPDQGPGRPARSTPIAQNGQRRRIPPPSERGALHALRNPGAAVRLWLADAVEVLGARPCLRGHEAPSHSAQRGETARERSI
jgi:hypothetical protein